MQTVMPTSLSTSPEPQPPSVSSPAQPARPASARWPLWLREPLLHFAVLGALLFAVDHFLVTKADDPNTIVVAAEVSKEARTLFRNARGREPNAEELQALTRRWIDTEILYREGLALRVDQGDPMIRERVIFKSLMLVESGLVLPPADDKTLRDWFEGQRVKYDEPMRFDFQEAVMTGDTSDAAAQAFAQTLNKGTPGDVNAGLRVFKGRPQVNLVQSYGAEFAKALEGAAIGEWRVLPTRDGPRVMRLDAIAAPRPAPYEAVRNAVLADWTDAIKAQMRTDAVRLRGKKYAIKFEAATP